MHDGHLNVIQDCRTSLRLLLNRLTADANLIREFVAEPSPARLVSIKRLRDIAPRRFPNEQARH